MPCDIKYFGFLKLIEYATFFVMTVGDEYYTNAGGM